jgi:tetratricopeptide (TPR) repeat protein
MKTIAAIALASGVIGLVAAAAVTGPRPRAQADAARPLARNDAALSPTPAQLAIKTARARIDRQPSRPEGHNELAMSLARRARETADPNFYTEAAAALAESRRVAPGNFEADKVEVWVLLGQHEFGAALDKARALNRKVPDDLMVYGMLVDAAVELGRYAEAEEAAQWMLDLRPGNIPGLTRAAYLRELFGDIEGSLELMRMAIDRVQPRETEERAWILSHISHLELVAGRLELAEQAAENALRLFPGYHYALGALAAVHGRKGDHAREAAILEERYRTVSHPENLFEWAAALERAGDRRGARAKFQQFETAARAEMEQADNANRELVLYYADHARRPAEALRVAERQIARRRDVATLDLYAWALFKIGRREEARRHIAEALAVGTVEPAIRRHAEAIQQP